MKSFKKTQLKYEAVRSLFEKLTKEKHLQSWAAVKQIAEKFFLEEEGTATRRGWVIPGEIRGLDSWRSCEVSYQVLTCRARLPARRVRRRSAAPAQRTSL